MFYVVYTVYNCCTTCRSSSEFCGRTNLMWKTQQLLWRLINVYCHLFYNKYMEVTLKYF